MTHDHLAHVFTFLYAIFSFLPVRIFFLNKLYNQQTISTYLICQEGELLKYS